MKAGLKTLLLLAIILPLLILPASLPDSDISTAKAQAIQDEIASATLTITMTSDG